jgi:preprotein translocase subunit SecG
MFTLFTVLIILACVLLVLIVLVQNSKGGGLAANFQSAGQFMGVRKTTDVLEKGTWILAGVLALLCIASTAAVNSKVEVKSAIEEEVQKSATNPDATPTFPTSEQAAPAAQPGDSAAQ